MRFGQDRGLHGEWPISANTVALPVLGGQLDRVIVDRLPDGVDKVKDTYGRRHREIGNGKRSVSQRVNLLYLRVLIDLPLTQLKLLLVQPTPKQLVPEPKPIRADVDSGNPGRHIIHFGDPDKMPANRFLKSGCLPLLGK